MKITLIDYGIGNYRSVEKAFEYVGAEVVMVDDPAGIEQADKLVLPGVGAFGAGMAALRDRGFVDPIRDKVAGGTPLLGICLGMQFLFEESEEMGQHEGLGVLPGRVVRFPQNGLKVPHMGWNKLSWERESRLLAGIPAGAYAYFVHSYYCQPTNPADTLAVTDYGRPVTAIVARDNVYGAQFHPEKSQQVGLRLLKNFVRL